MTDLPRLLRGAHTSKSAVGARAKYIIINVPSESLARSICVLDLYFVRPGSLCGGLAFLIPLNCVINCVPNAAELMCRIAPLWR